MNENHQAKRCPHLTQLAGISGGQIQQHLEVYKGYVMDVCDHAFMHDYEVTVRMKYVEAFFKNIDWSVIGNRLHVAPHTDSEPSIPEEWPAI